MAGAAPTLLHHYGTAQPPPLPLLSLPASLSTITVSSRVPDFRRARSRLSAPPPLPPTAQFPLSLQRVAVVCEILEDNAISAKVGNSECEPWVVTSWLRDHLLSTRETEHFVVEEGISVTAYLT
ncbi:hypothetical protein ZWY2020_025086 [Hordeum vulgare]|nr:hypothetical protein ZWY2020_025086 [Hordeum vulgare]